MGFRYRPSLGVPYGRQGLIYFTGRTYDDQPKRMREKIDRLCGACGGEHAAALKEFITTDAEIDAVCRRYFMSQSVLYRSVRNYYLSF